MKFLRPLFSLFALLFSSQAATPDDIVLLPPFGVKMMTFMSREQPGTEKDYARVGCFMLFCHIDDGQSCVHNRMRNECDCRVQCVRFAEEYTTDTMLPKTEKNTVWKQPKECTNDCVLLLSKRETSDEICNALCNFHFSFADREEYQKNVNDIFLNWFEQSPLRLM